MKVVLKSNVLIVVPETEDERSRIETWKLARESHVFIVTQNTGDGLSLGDLGSREQACREPINVVSSSSDPAVRLISNFAPTPFTLDGREYQSVEGFWQGLKFDEPQERRRIAELHGKEAQNAGRERAYGETVAYEGQAYRVGTWEHWQLMLRACRAKFTTHEAARTALLSTGERPLTHRVRHDSKTIPGVIMADIWMKIRRALLHAAEETVLIAEGEE